MIVMMMVTTYIPIMILLIKAVLNYPLPKPSWKLVHSLSFVSNILFTFTFFRSFTGMTRMICHCYKCISIVSLLSVQMSYYVCYMNVQCLLHAIMRHVTWLVSCYHVISVLCLAITDDRSDAIMSHGNSHYISHEFANLESKNTKRLMWYTKPRIRKARE